jgi:predicted small lipoprotein YifL
LAVGDKLIVAVAITAALGLSACGRKGGLDLPSAATPAPASVAANGAAAPAPGTFGAPAAAPANGVSGGFDAQGRPIATPPAEQKSFILDPLLR